MHGLGRIYVPDSRDYDLAQFVKETTTRKTRSWADKIVLDQGQTGHCVGFSWADWMGCAPKPDIVANSDGHSIYYACKVIDGEPHAEDGSSVRSGAKVMQNRSHLKTYAFTTNVDVVVAWLLNHGPVVVGTNWYNDMFNPNAKFRVFPTGNLAGGHAYMIKGVNLNNGLFRCQNSWGNVWGTNGSFFISIKDMATLLSNQGEACTAVEI